MTVICLCMSGLVCFRSSPPPIPLVALFSLFVGGLGLPCGDETDDGVVLGDNTVHLSSAPSPEGPWSARVPVYTATPIEGGLVYAGVAHPYLDQTGKTLTVSFTNNNHIEVVRLTFAR